MAKEKTLAYLIAREYEGMLRIGESKREAKAKAREEHKKLEGIYSFSTLKTYIKNGKAFGKWVQYEYNCRNVKKARKYVKKYLKMKQREGKSPFTIRTIASALAKLYNCSSTDFGVKFEDRKRENITRSRTVPDAKTEEKARNVVDFIKGSGLRRKEILNLRKEDIKREADGTLTVYVHCGKGGRKRTVIVLPEYETHIERMAKMTKENEKIFKTIPRGVQTHYYRACYAQAYYNKVARPLETLSNKEKYYMRGDRKGDVYDRDAMYETSLQLGHSRISVIAAHYLYTPQEGDT